MQNRYDPPTRKSCWQCGSVKSFGPHQRTTCSGFVHASNTSPRGALKTRVIVSTRSAGGAVDVVAMATIASVPLLRLVLRQVRFELLEGAGPAATHAVVVVVEDPLLSGRRVDRRPA